MKKISYIISPGSSITAVISGESHTITADNPSFGQVLEAIKGDQEPEYIADLFRTANAVKRYSDGKIQVSDDESYLTYGGEVIHGTVVDRILRFMSEGLPVEPLIKFLERLLANPSRRSIDELYKFLENQSLPITETGTFLGYKGVQDDYTDVHTGSFSNRIGAEHSMPRNGVDDDARRDCSNGFHVGSLQYATDFGPRTVIVEVDPADVVSVPYSDANKLRTSKYKVVSDYKGAIERPLVNAVSPYGEDYDDDDTYLGNEENGW